MKINSNSLYNLFIYLRDGKELYLLHLMSWKTWEFWVEPSFIIVMVRSSVYILNLLQTLHFSITFCNLENLEFLCIVSNRFSLYYALVQTMHYEKSILQKLTFSDILWLSNGGHVLVSCLNYKFSVQIISENRSARQTAWLYSSRSKMEYGTCMGSWILKSKLL